MRIEDSLGSQYAPETSRQSDSEGVGVVEYEILRDGTNRSRNPYLISVSANGYNEQREVAVDRTTILTFTIDSADDSSDWSLFVVLILLVSLLLLLGLILVKRRERKGEPKG